MKKTGSNSGTSCAMQESDNRQKIAKNERKDALNILIKVLQNKTPLSHALQSATDVTPFCKELCFGICRHYIRLQAIADILIKKRPKAKDFDIWLLILMGLYQLHDLHLPDYAVVQETVALLNPLKKTWAKGLVNATLRTYCREKESLIRTLQDNLMFKYGHPSWLQEKITTDWPNHWQTILHENDERPPLSLRVNTSHLSRDAYLQQLQQVNLIGMAHPYANDGIVLNKPVSVQDLPGFYDGDVSVQDTAAQMAVSLLDLKPGLRVLDACAAPGGKTCHILEQELQLSTVVALDIDKHRLSRIQDNLNRLKLNATLIEGDGLAPRSWWDGILFDRILLDAPCSATGVIRRHPDIKLLRQQEDIENITTIQHGLLHALWPLLASGGLLLYATCSIMPEENELQIAQFIKEEPSAKILPIQHHWGYQTDHGRQILPGDKNMDGFFYSVIKKQ